MRYIYILISTTPTKFGALIRKCGGVKYNHAAISLDENLTELYAFARKKHSALLSGHLVKEDLSRYTLNNKFSVDCCIYRINVSNVQYYRISNLVKDILNDKSYLYNLFSVLSFPIFNGFSTIKAFSCIEFVMFVLMHFTNVHLPQKSPCKFTPDELVNILSEYKFYKGDLKSYVVEKNNNEIIYNSDYFEPFNMTDFREGIYTLARLTYRLLFVDLS